MQNHYTHDCLQRPNAPRVQGRCLRCQEEFWATVREIGRSRGKFCSASCYREYRRNSPEHFWTRVEKGDGCWLWQGNLFDNGYGRYKLDGKDWGAHRLSYILTYGAISDDQYVCHKCEEWCPPGDSSYRACVRPDHLYLATLVDNIHDRHKFGRDVRGSRQHFAVLSDDVVREMRGIEGITWPMMKALAVKHGVHFTTIAKAVSGETWRHVR